ncbi:MAG: response regulator [Elainellaceae cyanobacterium]
MMNSQPLIRVLLVDDEEIVRYGLKTIIQPEATVIVVGEACNGREAIAQAEALNPDVILMDIGMPIMNGVRATGEILQSQPQVKILILTIHDDNQFLIEALQQGVAGYLLKNTPPADFIQIIQSTHKGYMQVGPSLGQQLSRQLKFPYPHQRPNNLAQVTPREQEVLQLIAAGASNREIAQSLYITEKTVKNHVSNILNRLGLRDRTQLAIWVNASNSAPSRFLSA